MLSKIYLGLLAIAFLTMGVFVFLCYSWTQSIGNPESIAQSYQTYASISWNVLWISFAALIILANVLLWKERKAWALWASFLFFAVFIVVQTFWLDQEFYYFQKANNLNKSNFFLKPFLGVTICAVGAIGIFFNQFIVLRMRDKMFGKSDDNESNPEEDILEKES